MKINWLKIFFIIFSIILLLIIISCTYTYCKIIKIKKNLFKNIEGFSNNNNRNYTKEEKIKIKNDVNNILHKWMKPTEINFDIFNKEIDKFVNSSNSDSKENLPDSNLNIES